MKTCDEIHDLIQNFDLGQSPDRMANKILNILEAMNNRMSRIEAEQHRTAKVQGETRKND